MIKDFYEDTLMLFPRVQDQMVLKSWHKLNPDDLKASSDDIFFKIDYDNTIDGIELMRRTLRVSAKAWPSKDPNAVPNDPLPEFIREAWYDLQYYHYHSIIRYLSKMVADNSYKSMPKELSEDYHDYNWYWKHEGAVNKHEKQRAIYSEYLANHDIHDIDSASAYLNKRCAKLDVCPFNLPKELVK